MNFLEATKNYFIKWKDFRSRSSRSEYWWATLFVTLASYPAGFILGVFIGVISVSAGVSETAMQVVTLFFALILQIFIIIASTCLVIRRLHDVDKSGWWYLIIFTIIGIIPLIIWYCTKGTDGDNRFGPDPLGTSTVKSEDDQQLSA